MATAMKALGYSTEEFSPSLSEITSTLQFRVWGSLFNKWPHTWCVFLFLAVWSSCCFKKVLFISWNWRKLNRAEYAGRSEEPFPLQDSDPLEWQMRQSSWPSVVEILAKCSQASACVGLFSVDLSQENEMGQPSWLCSRGTECCLHPELPPHAPLVVNSITCTPRIRVSSWD